jgi:hypothetical protein
MFGWRKRKRKGKVAAKQVEHPAVIAEHVLPAAAVGTELFVTHNGMECFAQ